MLKLDAAAMIDEINTRRPWKVYKWRNVAATGYSSYDVTIACSGHCCLSGGGFSEAPGDNMDLKNTI